MEPVSICFITDDNYVIPTSVAIASLIENKNQISVYDVYVLTSGLSRENKKRISAMQCESVKITILEVTHQDQLKNIKSNNVHVSSTALFKFSLAEILPKLRKVLYMDCDVLVLKDLVELYSKDIDDCYAGVVKDYRAVVSKPNPLEYLELKDKSYFNSGVMLLNLEKMRDDGIRDRLIDYRLHGYNHFMDQDTLNVVFGENVMHLPITYNLMYSTITHFSAKDICEYYQMPKVADIKQIYDECVIMHLCSPTKPWNYHDSWKSELWYSYYKKSPYKNRLLFRGYFKPATNCTNKVKYQIANSIASIKRNGVIGAWKKYRAKKKK